MKHHTWPRCWRARELQIPAAKGSTPFAVTMDEFCKAIMMAIAVVLLSAVLWLSLVFL